MVNYTEDSIVLKAPVYKKIFSLIVPVLAICLGIASAFLLLTAGEELNSELIKTGIFRIVACVAIAIFGVLPIFKETYYVIAPHKIMRFGVWELYYSDIKSVSISRTLFKNAIEIVPKNAPDVKYYINSFDINKPLKEVAIEIQNRTVNAKGIKK